jgi:hypothetical protein
VFSRGGGAGSAAASGESTYTMRGPFSAGLTGAGKLSAVCSPVFGGAVEAAAGACTAGGSCGSDVSVCAIAEAVNRKEADKKADKRMIGR